MGCEQVCLKWNNFSFNITKNIDDLWKDESLVDVSIISEGQCIQAHKVILSASSPLFKSLFAVNPCQHPVIILQDVRFRELVSIMTFIYKGEVNILEDSLPALLRAAKSLEIRGLSDSVDRDSLNRLYKMTNDNSNDNSSSDESRSKKRKLQKTPHHKSVISTEEEESKEEQSNDTIIPKDEPKNENFPADLFAAVSEDEEEIKPEDIVLQEQTQEMLQTDLDQAEDVALCTATEETTFPCPFCKRIYTNWGFRRRHIKAIHCANFLDCNLCACSTDFSLEKWIFHMLDDHEISSAQVQKYVSVYKEAQNVLTDDSDNNSEKKATRKSRNSNN